MRGSRTALERRFDPVTVRLIDAVIEGFTIHRALDTEPQDRSVVLAAIKRLTRVQKTDRGLATSAPRSCACSCGCKPAMTLASRRGRPNRALSSAPSETAIVMRSVRGARGTSLGQRVRQADATGSMRRVFRHQRNGSRRLRMPRGLMATIAPASRSGSERLQVHEEHLREVAGRKR